MNTLVTLGCSITEGQGCWGNYKKIITTQKHLHTEKEKYLDRFYEYGWPKNVGKELGFDKVINLGKIGSSTSGQLKHFMELEFNNQETIYVIWMLTEPIRFSFYSHGLIRNINPNNESEIGKAYLNNINSLTLDGCIEQLFYVKCLREICKARNYKLLITYWSNSSIFTQRFDKHNDDYLFQKPQTIYPINKKYISFVDGHPNEEGYKFITDKIVNQIDSSHKQFRVGNRVNDLVYETYDYKKYKL